MPVSPRGVHFLNNYVDVVDASLWLGLCRKIGFWVRVVKN